MEVPFIAIENHRKITSTIDGLCQRNWTFHPLLMLSKGEKMVRAKATSGLTSMPKREIVGLIIIDVNGCQEVVEKEIEVMHNKKVILCNCA